MSNEDEAYLEVPEEHIKKIAPPNTAWAKIDEKGQLELLRWDIVEMYALEYDTLRRAGKETAQTHVMCKLLLLVREQVRKEKHDSGN